MQIQINIIQDWLWVWVRGIHHITITVGYRHSLYSYSPTYAVRITIQTFIAL